MNESNRFSEAVCILKDSSWRSWKEIKTVKLKVQTLDKNNDFVATVVLFLPSHQKRIIICQPC